MRFWFAVVLFFFLPPAAKSQTLETPGWSWLETEFTYSYPDAIARAYSLKLEFPQIMVVAKGTGYAVVLGLLRTPIAETEASKLTADKWFSKITLATGQFYSKILFGADPFQNEKILSLGFPAAPQGTPNAPYIQVASRFNLEQALAIAEKYRDLGSGTVVVLSKNGWYSIALERSPQNKALLQTLKSEARIPADSQISFGKGYLELIWQSSRTPDQRLLASYPHLRFKTARDALSAGDGNSALRILVNDYLRNGTADFRLGAAILMEGKGGVSVNYDRARYWVSQCATDNVDCMVTLAYMTEKGLGGAKDPHRAFELYKKAADKGSADAQFAVGSAMLLGEGAIQDFSEAERYLKLGAIAGNADAQALLSITYKSGFAGKSNLPLAYFWSILATANIEAGKYRDSLVKERSELIGKISGELISEIQRAARDWKIGTPPPEFGEQPNSIVVNPKTDKGGTEQRKSFSGTGFFVSNSGHAVTNAHVVNGCRTVTVTTSDGEQAEAHVAARDPANDLALIQTTLKPRQIASFRAGIRLGEAVAVFGYPFAGLLSSGGNFTTGNVTALSGFSDDTRHVQISAPVQPGNSGGPLLDQGGLVIGVVVAKADALVFIAVAKDIPQNVNFAIKANVAQGFLDSNGIDYEIAKPSPALATEDLAERAKRTSIFIQCRP